VAGFFAAGELGPVGGKNFIHGHTASLALIRPASTGTCVVTRVFVVLIMSLVATSCTATAVAAQHPTAAATTRATTQPYVLRMADAVPAERFEGAGVELNLSQRIHFTAGTNCSSARRMRTTRTTTSSPPRR
jgi:hypothetical protein